MLAPKTFAAIGDSCTVDTTNNTDDCSAGICDDTIDICICVLDADCNIGESCVGGQCIALVDNCVDDSACDTGERCDIVNGGICVPFTPAPTGSMESSGGILTELTVLNPLSAPNIPTFIGQIVRFVTGIFGSIALLMMIYGGLQIMLAGGQTDKVKQGAKIIAWASIGLVTMMLSYVLVSFLLNAF